MSKLFQISLKDFIKINKYQLTTLFLLVFIIHLNSLTNDLVSDDKGLRVDGNLVGQITFLAQDPLHPLRLFLYFLLYHLGNDINPLIFRLSNIFFHLSNTFLVFLLISLISKKQIAFYTALLFAVHPILTETITWISGGGYAQYTFFFLASLVTYIMAKKRVAYYLSIIFFLLCLLSARQTVFLFLIFYLYEFLFGSIKTRFRHLLPFALISFIWGLFELLKVSDRVTDVNSVNNSLGLFYNPLYQIPSSLTHYLKLLFLPIDLAFSSGIDDALNPIQIAVVIGLLLFLIISFWKNKQLFFGLGLFFIGLLVFLTPFKISWVMAERYVYLSSIGIFFVFSLIFWKITKIPKLKLISLIIFTVIVVLLSLRTIRRNQDWANEYTLATATIKVRPNDPVAHNYLGSYYALAKDYDKALTEFTAALFVDPRNIEVLTNLGHTYNLKNDTDTALAFYQQVVALKPNAYGILQNMSELYYNKKDYQKVIIYVQRQIDISPENSTLYLNLGKAYLGLNDQAKAKEALTKAITINSSNTSAQALLKQYEK